MRRTKTAGAETDPERVDWVDPGYFSGRSVTVNTARLLMQLIHPPRGHRTLPTRTGAMLILITIGVGTAAFNTGQNILYLVLSLLLSTLLVSGILSWANFKGCRWRMETGRHFRAGETSPVYLELENTKRYLPTYDLTFRFGADRGEQEADIDLPEALGPGGKIRLLWEFLPEGRGAETLRLKGLLSRYPFGFLRKSIRDSLGREITVWPPRIAYQFAADKAGPRWIHGTHRRRGEGIELVHIRDYRSGDSLKRIHWKATARMGALQVRETVQEHHQAFVLHVDPAASLWRPGPQFERMCAFAASLAEDLYPHDQLKAVEIPGVFYRRVGAIEDLHRFLDALSNLEPDEAASTAAGVAEKDRIRFVPGPDGTVMARLGEHHVGQA